jgi:GWxTD domain-containing protein
LLLGFSVAQDNQNKKDSKNSKAAPARETVAKPLTEKEKKRREAKLRKELETPYRKWLNEDVAYIITDEERAAFKRMQTDEEREQFIEQFWLRRDPTPDSVENEFKEEHYRRIAYANEHYASGIPGWKADRGRIYSCTGSGRNPVAPWGLYGVLRKKAAALRPRILSRNTLPVYRGCGQ